MGNAPSTALQERMERNKQNFENLSPLCIRLKEVEAEKDKLSDKKRKLDGDVDRLDQKRVRLETKLSDLKDRLDNKTTRQEKVKEQLQQLLKEQDKLHEKGEEYDKYLDLINTTYTDLFDLLETTNDQKKLESNEDLLLETVTFEEKNGVLHYYGRLSFLFDDSVDKYFVLILWDMIDFMSTFVLKRTHVLKTTPIDETNKVGKHEIFLTKNDDDADDDQ